MTTCSVSVYANFVKLRREFLTACLTLPLATSHSIVAGNIFYGENIVPGITYF